MFAQLLRMLHRAHGRLSFGTVFDPLCAVIGRESARTGSRRASDRDDDERRRRDDDEAPETPPDEPPPTPVEDPPPTPDATPPYVVIGRDGGGRWQGPFPGKEQQL
jgi:hypothetical protein